MGNCCGNSNAQAQNTVAYSRPKTNEEQLLDRIQQQDDRFDETFPMKTEALFLENEDKPMLDTDVIGPKAILALNNDGVFFNFQNTLGVGSFGVVFIGRVGNDNAAVKVFNINHMIALRKEAFLKMFPRELAIIKRLDHDNIVTTLRIYLQLGSGRVYIFMERADIDLHKYSLQRRDAGNDLDEAEAKNIFFQMALGLNYMHSNLWSHRDIKLANCLVFGLRHDPKIIVKLTDFGFARSVLDDVFNFEVMSDTYNVFTKSHRPPEVYQKILYRPLPGDVWSLGVALFDLVNHRRPFVAPIVSPGVRTTAQNVFDVVLQLQLTRNYTWREPQRWSPEFKDIVARMLEPTVDDRLTVPQVLAHQWLN